MTQRHPILNDRIMLITTITKNRVPVFGDPGMATEAVETLYRVKQMRPFFLYAFVIMPDHCHFMIRVPPPATISLLMNVYKSGMTFNTGVSPLWQRRYHIRLVRTLLGTRTYIHQNPMKARLVDSAEQYLWSSASGRWPIDEWEIE